MAAVEEDGGVGAEADRELEELLESALDDFDKAKPSPAPPPTTTAPDASGSQKRSPGDTAKDALFASQEKFFQELFDSELASQATAEFEKAMKELAEEEPHLVEQFQKLSEAAGRVGSDATSQQEFTSCLKETLSGLAKNATDLQNSGMSEEELTKAMEGLGMDEGDGEGTILPIMQSIMQNLLSKDVLYPSLKEITEKYPEWLQTHRESLPPEQFEKYQEQHSVMGKICEQFEAETPTDSEATQKARFEVVLDLMQQVRPRLAVCPLLLSACVFSGGGVLEGCLPAQPRWRREHRRGHIAWSYLLFLFPYFPATGFGPSSKRACWGDASWPQL
ncbi:peroxisomal biogenesis factor 19 isoform X1 [Monodon monoceros]|uniref:peroxisomal biogenesis factor 19 isoform X1 n=1 Tax=Monodon monoceros TaxID=40151 RepID=UPI0010F82E06|nr:peroxisomal biogenesis factor 19 isoform X1 [Monodon monoceros]